MNGFPEFVRVIRRYDFIFCVEQIAFSIAFVNSAKNPAMAVKVGELGLFELLVKLFAADILQKLGVGPQAFCRGTFGISDRYFIFLLFRRIPLRFRIHELAVRFVVPPGVAEISGLHIRSGMNMADHALAGWNRSCKRMANGMSLLAPRNRGVGRGALSQISKLCVAGGVLRGAVVCVNHMARR